MNKLETLTLENWTVDYGDGAESCLVPHAWNQDVSVEFEGPVIYRTEFEVPRFPCIVRFHGVSYAAEIKINGEPALSHRGIWDAFDLDLSRYQGQRISIELSVVKNGGSTFPVQEVASGFLPYLFQTFGGIFREVVVMAKEALSEPIAPSSRVSLCGTEISVDDSPFHLRGVLHWGWYPELGHPNPSEETIRAEVNAIKCLGFNTVKFCLWVPPHRYLKVLQEEGMFAWMELPLWNPSDDESTLSAIAEELERIVCQYRGHDNVICWTVGCELGASTTAEFRERMVQVVQSRTGCPLVKDNSGGAEMYGGDLREYGSFDDFHPYCDLQFYRPVLESLHTGAQCDRPVLLGEYNDSDVHRDISRLGDELPFWASNMRELNAKGVRWQYDLPNFLPKTKFSNEPRKSGHRDLMESSRGQSLFIRKTVAEETRQFARSSGYVITGLRDTPVTSSGFFDDWGQPRFSPEECRSWNGDVCFFRIPTRRPPWIDGGNRIGWLDQSNFFAGHVFIKIGLHTGIATEGLPIWRIRDNEGNVVASGGGRFQGFSPCWAGEVMQVEGDLLPGDYSLLVEMGNCRNEWPLHVTARPESFSALKMNSEIPSNTETPALVVLEGEGTVPMPFWREAAYQFKEDCWGLKDRWERLLPICSDRAIDPEFLPREAEVLMSRIDVRTYRENPVIARIGDVVTTSLRPYGGLGIQPYGLENNPSGADFVRRLLSEPR